MEGVVTHFLADAERTVGLELIFADCTIPDVPWSRVAW